MPHFPPLYNKKLSAVAESRKLKSRDLHFFQLKISGLSGGGKVKEKPEILC